MTMSFPTSRAVNIPSEDNSVRTVVGGPLCESGLPFGHSVITGDRHGSITLKSLISGGTRKKLATTYHGHHNGQGKSCAGNLPGCSNEIVSVTVAEVISTGDDGSPTLWIGCADGSVQVYFLGGNSNNNNKKNNTNSRNRVSPSSRQKNKNSNDDDDNVVNSPTGGEQVDHHKNNDQNQQHNMNQGTGLVVDHDHDQPHCSHCGRATPPRQRSPPQNNNRNALGTSSTAGSARTGGKTFLSPTNNKNSRNKSPTTSYHARNNTSNSNNNNPAATSSSSFLFTPSDAHLQENLEQDGCVLLFSDKKHSGAIQCMINARSIDSAFTGGADWSIVRWRTSYPFGVISVIGRHSRSIRTLAFSPGHPCILFSGGDDGVVKLWNSRSRRPMELTGHRGSVLHVAPWYDTSAIYGDIFSALQQYQGGGNMTTIASENGMFASNSYNNNSNNNAQSQQQKAIGFISCGEDGTLRLWGTDSQVAACVLQVGNSNNNHSSSSSSSSAVVTAQIFSDNLIMAFAKDGSASIFHVLNFPTQAVCIYRFDNVGQVHRVNTKNHSMVLSPSGKKRPVSPSANSRISHYLHDVKVLGHLNGFLLWSLTSSGAKLSLLPLQHFESATKKQLSTISERREMLENLISETLDDDTDSTQGGQLLFQKILAAGDGSSGSAGSGFLLQLAKMVEQQQQQQANNSNLQQPQTHDDPHKSWNFDLPSEGDLLFDDPGQLTSAEQLSTNLRALFRSVNSTLSEMSRLNDEYLALKLDLQMKSFAKILEAMKAKQVLQLKKELQSMEGDSKKKEQLQVEAATAAAAAAAQKLQAASATPAKSTAGLIKVNPRKQIADMLQELFNGKRTTNNSALQSSGMSAKLQDGEKSSDYFGDLEKSLIDGLTRSVTGEAAAGYIFSYCLSKQQSVDPAFMQAQAEKKLQTQEIASTNEKLENDVEGMKKQVAVAKKQVADANAKVMEMTAKVVYAEKKVKDEAAKVLAAEERTKIVQKQLREEIAKRPVELKPMDAEARKKTHQSSTTGTMKFRTPGPEEGGPAAVAIVGDSSNNNTNNNNDNVGGAGGESSSTSTGPAPVITNIASLSLVVSTDKKMLMRRALANLREQQQQHQQSEDEGSKSDKDKPKKKKDSKNKSDEDEVANKKDVVGDQIVISMPGIGSWEGAERRSFGTQTRITKSVHLAVQAEFGNSGGSLRNYDKIATMNVNQNMNFAGNNKPSTPVKNASFSSSLFSDPNFMNKINGSSNDLTSQQLQQEKETLLQQQKEFLQQQQQQQFQTAPVVGWTDHDLELIRQSEDLLGKAAVVSQNNPYAELGGNNAENALEALKKKQQQQGDEDDDEEFGGGRNPDGTPIRIRKRKSKIRGVPDEDEDLADIGDTVAAALLQLRELETMYALSQKNLFAFEDAAFAEGLDIQDPKISFERERLRMEERALAEEMRRLHYLLTCPNSPLPGSDYYHNNHEEDSSLAMTIDDDFDYFNEYQKQRKLMLSMNSDSKNNNNSHGKQQLFGFSRKGGDDDDHDVTASSSPSKRSNNNPFLRSSHEGDVSLLKEFRSLIGKERERIQDDMFLSYQVASPQSCVSVGGGVSPPPPALESSKKPPSHYYSLNTNNRTKTNNNNNNYSFHQSSPSSATTPSKHVSFGNPNVNNNGSDNNNNNNSFRYGR